MTPTNKTLELGKLREKHEVLQCTRKPYFIIKRWLDIILGLIALIPGLPLMALCALCVKLDSRGPVLFIDNRIGHGGKLFKCYKFRTMYVNGDLILEEYLRTHPDAAQEWKVYKKLRGKDPRVTRVGGVLRRYSLDELPQIFNVLKGEMSLVGPRPYLPREWPDMKTWRHVILTVKPGITGLWQVSGRNNLSFAQRMRLEAWYARHESLALDLWILMKTVTAVLLRSGAY